MKVYCLVFDGFSDWEAGYILPELKNNGYEVVTVGFDTHPIESMGGLQVMPHKKLSEVDVDSGDLFIIPGGERWQGEEDSLDLLETIKKFHAAGKPIAAICGATIFLARNGFLNDCQHTSNTKEYLQQFAKDYTGGDNYLEELSVSDKNIITASGLGSIEFAYEILKVLQVYTPERCKEWYHFFKG